MTDALDPHLRYVQAAKRKEFSEMAEGHPGLEADGQVQRVSVLVRYDGDPAALEDAGLEIGTVAGDVVTGTVAVGKLDGLAAVAGVSAIEGSRPVVGELDLALADSRAVLVHAGPPGHRGAGVVVGIVDSGIDWRHENFLRPDGTSRILFIWDQFLAPAAGEAPPAGFTFGVEYSRAQINAALAGTGVVRHADGDTGAGHGTHVAGIAAGDGSAAGQNRPAGTFVGVAPEADIIVVANQGGGARGLGDSARSLDAIAYILGRAAALNRPVVVNMSQGDNLGPHDGTSLLERGIDNLLGAPGRAMVKSAGNAAADRIHATGTVAPGGQQVVQFTIPASDTTQETIDIWYPAGDRMTFRITEPGGPTSATVAPGTSTTLALGNGNQVFVDSRINDPNNGDGRIFLTIGRGGAQFVEAGTWSFTLAGTTITSGRFHAWVQRGLPNTIAQFLPPHEDPDFTISTPGTAREVIAAGSYVTRGTGAGSASSFSSRGPTRDGRPAPNVSAPGQMIISARAAGIARPGDAYHALQGTSMSAPHVTGAIALMLQAVPTLTQQAIRDCLRSTARADAFTATVPNTVWGAGKLDAAAAMGCAAPPLVTTVIRTFANSPCRTTDQVGCIPQTILAIRCGRRTLIEPECVIRTALPGCRITRGPECPVLTRGPECPPRTRDPGCLRPTLLCPRTVGPDCGPIGIDPAGPVVNPAIAAGPIGRTIVGRENPETGHYSWVAFDPYGQVEAVAAEGAETWSDLAEDEGTAGGS